MACPVCDHTMKRLNDGGDRGFYWCSRCGTIKIVGCGVKVESPKLVGYATELADCASGVQQALDDFTAPIDVASPIIRCTRAVRECCTISH